MPFTVTQFLEVFQRYNQAVWPAQLVFIVLAAAATFAAVRGDRYSRYITGLLAFLWAWDAVVYHVTFFRAINPAAVVFAILSQVETMLLVWNGVMRGRITFGARGPWRNVGVMLIGYSIVLYPLLGFAFGQRYPQMPTFGLPCPTTIFTLGMLMCTRPVAPLALWIVPLLWTIVGTQAAMLFGVREDFGLAIAGALSLYYVVTTLTGERRRAPAA